ncbi:Deleted in malignant brain tumors 1 protein [Mizuhopecten yessoensis]|uniref:Deleted in malignant brain tumors 1 protein n=1 Tax=Mizuhopecten yessoensis TaxID=6573 RepID=A0A210PLR9_MIZYE|nr:Deleted in malignant brain tumors 1 protein [Mizuhopecten yessoensis]
MALGHRTALGIDGQLTLQDIRLVDGTDQYEGRLEVKYNDTWGTVCTDYFEDKEAEVICRELQYTGGAAVTDGRFGDGTGKIWLDNLGCEGNEQSLATCQANNIGVHNCKHSDDAGVICQPHVQTSQPQPATLIRGPGVPQPSICPGSTDPQIRLVGPNNTVGVGFVEVKNNGAWGAVCDDHWDIQDARVVCGSLCFNKSLSLTGATYNIDYVKANVSQVFLLDDVGCSGSETNIFNCQHRGIGVSNCQPGEYASVTCTPILRTVEQPPEPDLSCDHEQFTASFSRMYDPGLTYSGVTVDQALNYTSHCNPKYSNTSAHIIIKIPFDECGTEISTNASHIFYNITLAYNNNSVGVITRKNFYYVKLTCEFLRNKTNDAGYTAQPNQVTKSSRGEFAVGMMLYEDENFNQPLSESPTLQMNQPLSASLHLETSLDHLKIVVRTCFATPSGSWTDPLNYMLFKDNCANDETVAIIPWNETSSGFRFSSFKFVGYSHIYLHCTSLVCEMQEKDQLCDRSCNPTNTAGRRRRRRRRSSRRKRNDYAWLYSTSQLLTINDDVDGPVIERFPTTDGSVSRMISSSTTTVPNSASSSSPTVTVTQRPTKKAASPGPETTSRTTSFSTLQPSSSSVEVIPGIVVKSTSLPTGPNLESNEVNEIPDEEASLLDGTLAGDVSSASRVMTSLLPLLTIALLSRSL